MSAIVQQEGIAKAFEAYKGAQEVAVAALMTQLRAQSDGMLRSESEVDAAHALHKTAAAQVETLQQRCVTLTDTIRRGMHKLFNSHLRSHLHL